MRVAKGFCMMCDGPKISSMRRDGAKNKPRDARLHITT